MTRPENPADDLLAALRRSERALERYRHSHRALAADVRQLRSEVGLWRCRAQALESSRGVRVAGVLRRAAGEVAPPGTTRRAVGRVLARRGYAALQEAARRHADRVAASGGAPRTDGHREDSGPGPGDVPPVPMALQPEVSIVVPVHDQWASTAACLRSIVADNSAVGYEVIVVDDASTDDTPARLARAVGVHTVRLDENLGFVGAVNAGTARARGRYVVLLNNDTEVAPGWLDALVDTADADPSIGVVGAKLIYPDGRLQEAGGIIWEDASGHNYGRDQDPDDLRYAFVRDVDYCSGACLLVRADLLAMVGGLDTRYSPAYYEDTDLCFSARRHGYRVVYQPQALVLHHEGVSHGTDLSSGVKRFQEVNRSTFAAKWAAELARHGRPDHAHVRAASRRSTAGHCLVIDHALPTPDFDSGSRRMSALLGILAELGFAVTFLPDNGIRIQRYLDALTSRGIEVLGSPGDLEGYISGVLPDLRLAVMSRPMVAWSNYPMLRSLAPETLLVYDTVDLHFVREQGRALHDAEPDAANRSAKLHHGLEMSLVRLVDQVWTVSDVEAEVLLRGEPSLDVAVVPNIHPEQPAGPPWDPREGILFVGSFSHHPNRDAAQWLAEEILPLVHAELGDVPLYLAGSGTTPAIEGLGRHGATVLGWVPDLEDLYRTSRVFVAPLRFGAGMKGKVGEACSYGLPVVSTSVGVEGLHLAHGSDVLVADDAASFAAAVVRLYQDPELWARLAEGGRREIRQQLCPSTVRAHLAQTLKALGLDVVEPK